MREVVGDEGGRRIGNRFLLGPDPRHPRARARTATRTRRQGTVGRRPVADDDTDRSRSALARARPSATSGLPATSGRAPAAVATAATSAPAPGTRPPGTGYVGVDVRRDEAARRRAPRRRRGSTARSRTRDASRRRRRRPGRIDDVEAARGQRLTTPGPAHASTRAPASSVCEQRGRRLCARRDVVGVGVDSHRRELADVVLDPAARVVREEHDAQPGTPAAARRASAEPGIGSSPRQITPSRSQQRQQACSSTPCLRTVVRRLGEGPPVVVVVGAHHGRRAEVPTRAVRSPARSRHTPSP